MLPKSLNKLLSDPRVDEILDERSDDNGYWVYFKPGWINWLDETHSIHEMTAKEVLDKMKTIRPCDCDYYCKGEK